MDCDWWLIFTFRFGLRIFWALDFWISFYFYFLLLSFECLHFTFEFLLFAFCFLLFTLTFYFDFYFLFWPLTNYLWLMTMTIIICFNAKDEIHNIHGKLGYSFYYASLMVVWLLDYWKLAQTQSNIIFRLL